MSQPEPRVKVNDPGAMRALAHPLRLRLLGLLRTDGPRTVGQLADAVDEAPGSVSYHLGTLARHGFVVEAPELARDGREHWWRAAHEVTNFDIAELRGDESTYQASLAMRRVVLQSYLAEQLAALDAESALDHDWLDATTSGDQFGHLTAAELAELSRELEELSERWSARSREPREGTRPVRWLYASFVRPDAYGGAVDGGTGT